MKDDVIGGTYSYVNLFDSVHKLGTDLTYIHLTSRGYNVSWLQLDLVNQSMNLQRSAYKLKDYLTRSIPEPTLLNATYAYNKSVYEQFLEFAAVGRNVALFQNSYYLLKSYLERCRLILPNIFVNTVNEIDVSYTDSLADTVAASESFHLSILIVFAASWILIYVCLICAERQGRMSELAAISLISTV